MAGNLDGLEPFRLTRDAQDKAILIPGDGRHNLGPWEAAGE